MNKKEKLIFWILGIIIALFLLGGFGVIGYGTMGYGFGGMMGMMYGSYGSGMMLFGWLYGILIITALTLLIIWLFKQINKGR
jgi:Na+/H+-dicarboxylate symporter